MSKHYKEGVDFEWVKSKGSNVKTRKFFSSAEKAKRKAGSSAKPKPTTKSKPTQKLKSSPVPKTRPSPTSNKTDKPKGRRGVSDASLVRMAKKAIADGESKTAFMKRIKSDMDSMQADRDKKAKLKERIFGVFAGGSPSQKARNARVAKDSSSRPEKYKKTSGYSSSSSRVPRPKVSRRDGRK